MKRVTKVIIIIIAVILTFIIGFVAYDRLTIDNKYGINEKNLKIPILVYHDIVENESEVEYDYMQTPKETFEKQITGLMKLGYKPISYEELIAYKNGEEKIYKKSFLIAFDDGFDGVYQYAYPFAKEHNIPITSFIINYCVGLDGYYTWDNAREMDKSGVVKIYSHSLKHDNYDTYSKEDLLEDVNTSIEQIEKELGHNIKKIFTYPCGKFTEEEQEYLWKNGIIQNLTDNKVNQSKNLDLAGLHRMYPLNDSVLKILLKIEYRSIKYPA